MYLNSNIDNTDYRTKNLINNKCLTKLELSLANFFSKLASSKIKIKIPKYL